MIAAMQQYCSLVMSSYFVVLTNITTSVVTITVVDCIIYFVVSLAICVALAVASSRLTVIWANICYNITGKYKYNCAIAIHRVHGQWKTMSKIMSKTKECKINVNVNWLVNANNVICCNANV